MELSKVKKKKKQRLGKVGIESPTYLWLECKSASLSGNMEAQLGPSQDPCGTLQ